MGRTVHQPKMHHSILNGRLFCEDDGFVGHGIPYSGFADTRNVLNWPSKIFRSKSGLFRDASHHFGANLLPIVESENKVRPTGPSQRSVRSRLTLDHPSELQKRAQDLSRFTRSISFAPQ
jgi:hypothetical protein